MIEAQTVSLVAQNVTGMTKRQVQAVLNLMDDGNTVPFIARYRKEMTGSLDEVQIQAVEDEYQRATALASRKQAVIKALTEQGKLSPALQQAVLASTKLQDVEDIYLPTSKSGKLRPWWPVSRGWSRSRGG